MKPTIQIRDIDLDALILEYLHNNVWVEVLFEDDEVVEMPSRKMVLLAHYWKIVRKWGFKITNRYVVDTTVVNSSFLSKMGTLILQDVLRYHPEIARDLNLDLWATVNELNKFASRYCQAYVRSINALDFIRIKRIPEVKAIIEDKVDNLSEGIGKASAKIGRNTDKLFNALKIPHPDNAFYPFINLKLVNATQIGHLFYQVGIRTDINDRYIGEPVTSNYWDGIQTRNEYAYEALAAKKSIFYNKMQLPTADYFGRKQHLALSSLHTLHKGDCGTELCIDMVISEINKSRVLWKYIMENTRLVLLTERNIDKYVGKVVKMRSSLTCRHTDGVCSICGGALLSMIHPSINIGIYAGTKISQTVVQTVLKVKHVADVNVMGYKLPHEISGIFQRTKTFIRCRKAAIANMKKAVLVLNPKEAIHILNLKKDSIGRLNGISESSFGAIRFISIKINDELTHANVDMAVSGQTPMFSKEMIRYIANNKDRTYIKENLYHIPLDQFNFDEPLFKLIMVDYSMVKFVRHVERFLERDVSNYTDIAEAFTDFCELIYQQVSPNVAYAELVLKATLATSKSDVRIPVVSDTSNVTITNNVNINRQRSLGTALAFEDLFHCLLDPMTFLAPKPYNPFDDLLNLKRKRR